MDKITNSIIKEKIRQKNESEADRLEGEIRDELKNDLDYISLDYKENYSFFYFVLIGGAFGVALSVFWIGFGGILVGIAISTCVWFIINDRIKSSNTDVDRQKQQLQLETDNKIRQVHIQAYQKTRQEIMEYEDDVNKYAQKVKANEKNITPMVEHTVDMFQRMILHANADSDKTIKFVEADFTYEVLTSGIVYMYRSQYTNPQDDYNFNKERYRDLESPAECEGLAKALAELVIDEMKMIYKSDSVDISQSSNDAKIMFKFKSANRKFIPKKNIV